MHHLSGNQTKQHKNCKIAYAFTYSILCLAEHQYRFYHCLSEVKDKSVIMIVVDMLSKYVYFSPLSSSFNASKVAEMFTQDVVRLHGILSSIVSEKDRVFTFKFLKRLINFFFDSDTWY